MSPLHCITCLFAFWLFIVIPWLVMMAMAESERDDDSRDK